LKKNTVLILLLLVWVSFGISSPWYSIKRISFNISGNLNYNPWEDYNNAVEEQAHEVMYNPWYISPNGNYEKIYNDKGYNFGLQYRIFKKVKIGCNYTDNNTKADFEFYPTKKIVISRYLFEYDHNGIAYQQYIDFNISSFNYDLSYELFNYNRSSINSLVGISFIESEMKFDWNYSRWHGEGPIDLDDPKIYPSVFQSKLKDKTMSYYASLEIDYKLLNYLSVFTTLDLRLGELDDLNGSSVYNGRDCNSKLVKSKNYFGVSTLDKSGFYGNYYLLNFGEEYPIYKKASINLNSVGFKMGIRIGF